MARANTRAAAVTGAGGGLGRDIALGLAAKHYRVLGTAMNPEEIADLQQASGGTVSLTRCDITDDDAVKRWGRDVASQTGGGLDLLVNNAGILTPGPLEGLSLEAIRREFDVNVFGSLSVINAFLPAVRHRRGRGRAGQHENGRSREDGGGPSTSRRWHDGRTARTVRTYLQLLCERPQQHAVQRARLRVCG